MSSTAIRSLPRTDEYKQPKPDGICMSSIHKWDGRIMVCVEIWFSGLGLEKVAFYEPGVDKIHHASYDEIISMMKEKKLVIHQPARGRLLK